MDIYVSTWNEAGRLQYPISAELKQGNQIVSGNAGREFYFRGVYPGEYTLEFDPYNPEYAERYKDEPDISRCNRSIKITRMVSHITVHNTERECWIWIHGYE